MLGIMCLVLVAEAVLLAWQIRRIQRQERLRKWMAKELASVTKELATWDRTKELGFDDVLEWEAAFELATGALPEKSRTKELAAKWEQEANMALSSYHVGNYVGGYGAIAANSIQASAMKGMPIHIGGGDALWARVGGG